MKITVIILTIAPLAISVQRELIISTFEYTPTPKVAAKKDSALIMTDLVQVSLAMRIEVFLSSPLFLSFRYLVVIRIA